MLTLFVTLFPIANLVQNKTKIIFKKKLVTHKENMSVINQESGLVTYLHAVYLYMAFAD